MRKRKTRSSTSHTSQALYTDVQLLIAEIQQRRLILIVEDSPGNVEIWSPGVKVPKSLQRGVFKHQHMLVQMITDADMRVCPTPLLHKRYHKLGVCLACKRIDRSLNSSMTIESIAS